MRPTIPDSGFVSAGQEALRKIEIEMQPVWDEIAEQREQRDDAILRTAKILSDLDEKLDEERTARKTADDEAANLTIRWNKINLAVGISGVILAFAGVVVAVVALFEH